MEKKDLEIFLSVYDYQSMTKAAQALYLSPQSVSNTILRIEDEFGVSLFDRTAAGSFPTQEAELLKGNAQKLIDDYMAIEETFSGGKDSKKILKIASTTGVFRYLTLDFIEDFCAKYPFIKLEIIEQLDPTVDELLWNEAVELAFNSAPVNYVKFDAMPFSSHKYCCLMHHSNPLASKEKIKYADLKGQPLAMIGSFSYYLNRLYKENFTPNIVFKTIDITFLNEIAENNQAIGISIDYVARPFLGKNSVIRYFEDDDCTWDSMLITKKNKRLSMEALLFKTFALEWVSKRQ